MANRALHHSTKKPVASNPSLASRALLSLVCAVSLYFCFSLFRKDSQLPSLTYSLVPEKTNGNCSYSDGRWIYDPTVRSPPRYDHTCKEIFKGWNCIASNKTNALDILRWRWKPHACDLPPFDPWRFLENFRDTNIGFVGDSLNRNMFASLFCALKKVSPEVKKWRPVGADRGFTFLKYNLTIAYHRTNLLARYGRWSGGTTGILESLGYKDGYRIDVDIPDGTWAEAPHFHDILIFNTGHWWWAPSKFDPVKSPMLFFEKGVPVSPPLSPDAGLDMVLRHMISFVEKNARQSAILLFRTQSPRHFEGGDWDQGGSCPRIQPLVPEEVEQLFSIGNNGTNVETRLVNEHLYRALKGSRFQILDITRVSEFRADAHPSAAGGKRHDDCMHWCLPGLTDTWNDLFIAQLNSVRGQNTPQDYLNAHNVVRARVGVRPVTWDEKVANFARSYVRQRIGDCNLVHSTNRPYGENLAKGGGDFTGEAAVALWAKERPNYNSSSNSCVGGQCLHYTQVVWHDSVRVGCARAPCNNGWWFVSCNYDPPGNYIGQRPY